MKAFDRYLTESEQQRLLRHMERLRADPVALRDGALIRLLLHTGMRLGETVAITVAEASAAIRDGWLFIPRERRKRRKRDHTVLVTLPVRDALQDLLTARAALTGRPIATDDAPLLASRQGQGLTARAVEYRVRKWTREAGLGEHITPHYMRHTRAKNIMRRSTSTDPRGIVQAALGHASIASTGIYTTVSREDLAAALTEVDQGAGDRRRLKRGLRQQWQGRAAA